jgi:hypothetical protein
VQASLHAAGLLQHSLPSARAAACSLIAVCSVIKARADHAASSSMISMLDVSMH